LRQKIEAFCEVPACGPDESNFKVEHADIFVELDKIGVRVSRCKDDEADVISDPQGGTGHCIGKDEMKVSGSLEEEYSP